MTRIRGHFQQRRRSHLVSIRGFLSLFHLGAQTFDQHDFCFVLRVSFLLHGLQRDQILLVLLVNLEERRVVTDEVDFLVQLEGLGIENLLGFGLGAGKDGTNGRRHGLVDGHGFAGGLAEEANVGKIEAILAQDVLAGEKEQLRTFLRVKTLEALVAVDCVVHFKR